VSLCLVDDGTLNTPVTYCKVVLHQATLVLRWFDGHFEGEPPCCLESRVMVGAVLLCVPTVHQKGRAILDFNEARDDGVAAPSAGPYAPHFGR